jgi:hypothetical protein
LQELRQAIIVNLINHNLSGVKISTFFNFFNFFEDFFEKISILEVEIGRNGPRILGVNKARGLELQQSTHYSRIDNLLM